jgi:hypothetical protein
MKLKPSRYHVVSSSRICGAGPAQERLRSLKADAAKASSQRPQATLVTQPKIGPRAKMARAIQQNARSVRQGWSASRPRTGARSADPVYASRCDGFCRDVVMSDAGTGLVPDWPLPEQPGPVAGTERD